VSSFFSGVAHSGVAHSGVAHSGVAHSGVAHSGVAQTLKDRDPTASEVTGLLVSVVIPHLNQLEHLDACLESLEAQTLERSLFEIIVVDNGSSPQSDAVVACHPSVRLLREPKPGPGPARNLGARNARAPVLCFIDADCRAHRDWLSVALRSITALPAGTILGGDVQIWRGDRIKLTAIGVYESIFAYRQRLHVLSHQYSGTGNLAVWRGDFEKIGPFGGILLPEDMDWGHRAVSAGFVFKYVPEMIVFHPAQPSFKNLCIQWDREIRHALTKTRRERFSWRIRWAMRALVILCSPIVHSLWVISDRRVDLLSRCKAVAVLVAIRSYRAWRMMGLLGAPRTGVLWNRDAVVDAEETG
jgi:glycosyltransferase involved in cell wall biosynthesis